MYDISHPLVSNCRVKKDRPISSNSAKPSTVAANVYQEHAHNRSRDRRLLSAMLPGVMSFASELIRASVVSFGGQRAAGIEGRSVWLFAVAERCAGAFLSCPSSSVRQLFSCVVPKLCWSTMRRLPYSAVACGSWC